jgi:hypothetical protein
MKHGMIALAMLGGSAMSQAHAAMPAITGSPTIDAPQLLYWPQEVDAAVPDLTESTANRLTDLHGNIGNCENMDLVLSTAGNYHMALRDLWRNLLLPSYGDQIKNWYYTTSPPIAAEQITNKYVAFGNLSLHCVPQVVVAPNPVIQRLQSLGLTDGAPFPVFQNRGNVILVKKGNPKHIKTVWDLGRPNVKVVLPHKTLEKSTFDNYSGSIYNIAANDPYHPFGWTAEHLFDSIFNNRMIKDKWLSGGRIHHREVPWSVAYGRADAGLLFYHLALDAVRTFPDMFEIVPLGGTVDDPSPLQGNRIGVHQGIRILGDWTGAQADAREKLVEKLQSSEFTEILMHHGMNRP